MDPTTTTRRQFVRSSAALAAAAGIASRAYAAGPDTLRVGLVGCGGRGMGAAVNALLADSNVKLVALGDLFPDMLETALKSFGANAEVSPRLDVPPERRFTGFDAYKHVIDNVDVVLLCTTPHFRPLHLKYAVEKGVHAFVEKPVATDAAGARDVLATCRKAKEKGLAVVSGLCWRYHDGKRQTIQRIHDGTIGDIVACETHYLAGQLWHRGRKPEWSEMEYQCRNWLYFDWLSGDFNTEQHVHSLDKIAWALGDRYPIRGTAMGGRSQRTGPEYGNVYDHFSTVYEYADGLKVYSSCRQMNDTTSGVWDNVMGTKGTATLNGNAHHVEQRIVDRAGGVVWRYTGKNDDMYQREHDELFASIRSGKPINNGEYMTRSTFMAILARESAYTGQTPTWDEVWNSKLDHTPPAYAFGSAPQRPIAVPGVYKLPK